ncbi:uncharacterized protein LOC136079743 isoform X1 [Hydra vulgaris]|uniref:Uncharacterized protein LOC136079743 isoform X1 n=1 Tax=Hydra vulgaris TaxID=6087 RepID=A0ABM4BSG7_HYDVU
MAAKNNVVCFTCSTCGVCKYSMQKYLEHMHIMHEHTAGYVVVYNIDGCTASYKSVKCLREHMRNKHSSTYYNSQATINEFNVSTFEVLESQISENFIDESNSDDLVVGIANNNLDIFQANLSISPLDKLLSSLQNHFAMFIVGIAEKHSMPSVVQDDVANEVQSFLTYYNNSFCTILKEQLCKNFVSTDNLDEPLNSHLL